jgi:hypothetical protein
MPSPTVPGEGTLLQHGTSGGSPTYTTITRRTVIDGPEMAIAAIEDTDLDASAHTYRPSQIQEGGTISLKIYYNPDDTTHLLLVGFMTPPTAIQNWRIVIPNDGTHKTNVVFTGIMTKFKVTGMEIEKNVEAEVEIKVSGLVAITAGS